jgi:hypothetical protein
MDIDELIFVKQNSLSREFCDNAIEKFEKDTAKYQGVTGSGITLDTKQSFDLSVSRNDDWVEEDNVFSKSLSEGLVDYSRYLNVVIPSYPGWNDLSDTGYQMQRTEPNSFYNWHHDSLCEKTGDGTIRERIFTFIWYLNDVDKRNNGYTEFIGGSRHQPKCGDLLFFPSTWLLMHRGYPPRRQKKYICTGWLYSNIYIGDAR